MKGLQALLIASCVLLAAPAAADETLKLTVGQRGNWDTSVSEIGQRAGIFKKHGLTLELVYTQGSGETQQPVVAGSVDIGVAVGIMGALSFYSKGAPVRIIGAETTGAADLYWYVQIRFADPLARRTPPARPSPFPPRAPRPTASSPPS